MNDKITYSHPFGGQLTVGEIIRVSRYKRFRFWYKPWTWFKKNIEVFEATITKVENHSIQIDRSPEDTPLAYY